MIVAIDRPSGSSPDQKGNVPLPYDFALLTLAKPLGDQLGTLSLAGTVPSAAYQARIVVQASQDKAHILSTHQGCRLTADVGRGLVGHDCDATKGDSGSPLFVVEKDRISIIGLHVATAGRSGFEFGVAVTSQAIRRTLLGGKNK